MLYVDADVDVDADADADAVADVDFHDSDSNSAPLLGFSLDSCFYVTAQSYIIIGLGDIPFKKFKPFNVIFFIFCDDPKYSFVQFPHAISNIRSQHWLETNQKSHRKGKKY